MWRRGRAAAAGAVVWVRRVGWVFSLWGARPYRFPFCSSSRVAVAALFLLLLRVLVVSPCRVVMRCPWVSPPCFLIVYAPAMRAVAYYALSVIAGAPRGSERGIVSRVSVSGCGALACARDAGFWLVLRMAVSAVGGLRAVRMCAAFFCEAAAVARGWTRPADTLCAAWPLADGVEWVGVLRRGVDAGA